MSTRTCSCSEDISFDAFKKINEGADNIRDGIFNIRVGRNSIQSGFITCGTKRCCEGLAACKQGACDIAAGLKGLRPEELSRQDRRKACEGLRDIQKGICRANEGVRRVRQGDVRMGNCAIEDGLCGIWDGLAEVLTALDSTL